VHHTIARMSGKPEDYQICSKCGSWNWYENENCVSCGEELKGSRRATEQDANRLYDVFKRENDVDSVELEV
jgi:ribosomal protein L40E